MTTKNIQAWAIIWFRCVYRSATSWDQIFAKMLIFFGEVWMDPGCKKFVVFLKINVVWDIWHLKISMLNVNQLLFIKGVSSQLQIHTTGKLSITQEMMRDAWNSGINYSTPQIIPRVNKKWNNFKRPKWKRIWTKRGIKSTKMIRYVILSSILISTVLSRVLSGEKEKCQCKSMNIRH